MFNISRNRKILLIMLILFISAIISYGKDTTNCEVKNAAIYNVVKEVFLTDKGYSDELSNHVSKDVFEKTNIYNVYNVNNQDYQHPLTINFKLKADSENKVKDIVYIKMIYSINITDSENKVIRNSNDIPITFTIENIGNNWYIAKKDELA